MARSHLAFRDRQYPGRRTKSGRETLSVRRARVPSASNHRPDVVLDDERERERLVERIARLDRDFRRACLDAPIDEDPLYPILLALYPEGARLIDIGRAYGYSPEFVRLAQVSGLARLRPRLDEHLPEHGPSGWDELELYGADA